MLHISDIPRLCLFAIQLNSQDHLIAYRRQEDGRVKFIGRREGTHPVFGFSASARVLTRDEEVSLLRELAYVANELAKEKCATSTVDAVSIFGGDRRVMSVRFLPSPARMLEVCSAYHEISSVIACAQGR